MTYYEHYRLVEIYEGNPWDVRKRLKAFIDRTPVVNHEEPKKGNRTGQQNRTVHLDCKLISEKLDAAGLDMRTVLKPTYSLPWTTESVKEHIWKPIMKALTGKESTKELQKGGGEIEKIHEVIMRELGQRHGIEWHDFPNDMPRQLEDLGGYRIAAGTQDVPEMDETNRADKF